MPTKREGTPEDERDDIERKERESFERRAQWWRLHYGEDASDVDERTREAAEQAERMKREER